MTGCRPRHGQLRLGRRTILLALVSAHGLFDREILYIRHPDLSATQKNPPSLSRQPLPNNPMARRDKVKEKSTNRQSVSFDLTGDGTDLGGAVAGELLDSLISGPLAFQPGAALGCL